MSAGQSHYPWVPPAIARVDASAALECTVLFCDIRGFTRLLEHTPPKDAFSLIETFLRSLTSAVIAEGGSVNNLTGDGFLAQFGIGLADHTHALRAVNCAIEMRGRLKTLNLERHLGHVGTFAIGVGINTGTIAGGEIRLGDHTSFLLIGDAINLASRIESLTKEFALDLLISAATYSQVQSHLTCLAMPPRAVKGRTEKLATYWIPPHARPVRSYSLQSIP